MTEQIDFWKKCEVNNLVNHFHKYNPVTSQADRLGSLFLPAADIKELFHTTANDKETLDSFVIHMALDQETSHWQNFSFRPTLAVTRGKKVKAGRFDYPPVMKPVLSTRLDDAEVPDQFKQWVCKNWMEMDTRLVNEAFVGTFGESAKQPVTRSTRRLLAYYFSEALNPNCYTFIRNNRNSITGLIFHLGADMNKNDHHEVFTFSPVLEIQATGLTRDDIYAIHRLGLKSYEVEPGVESVFYEYMAPCPSTCPAAE